ncbi:uncharacterized protein LOC131064583 isoform X2 [Cryptomeria japonica]|uniref:uncharacterized protein LOC131064583 isoform X2 n=1 Tax=Cryptomeria japonica TaxID=3369 RepID=UPI0027DA1411|nr:uncharacterized protein LOC131064583 isoform X2 [Cryptomeria japonica]
MDYEGLSWMGVRLGVAAERELYERTKKAAEEAQRQGAAQLKAAVKAGGAVKPLCDSYNWWSLGFRDSRLEGAYRLKSVSYMDSIASFPVACELAACTLHLFRPKMINDSPSSQVHFLVYIWIAVCCITVLSSQMLFSKWYQGCRGIILQYMTTILWIWESIQIFLMADTEWTYISYHALALSTCTSILYQIPFCMHLRLRIFGLACQAAAISARGKRQDSLALLFVITASHLLGVFLAYVLDRRARLHFLKSMPCWQAEGMKGSPNAIESQFMRPCRDSIFRQYWSMFCNQSLEKSSSNLSTVMITPVDRATPHRALGGFAGGFAGVSGLKCRVPPPMPLFSFTDSHSEHGKMSGSELSNDTNDSKNTVNMILHHKHNKVEDRWIQETTADSACSHTEGRCTIPKKLLGDHD